MYYIVDAFASFILSGLCGFLVIGWAAAPHDKRFHLLNCYELSNRYIFVGKLTNRDLT